MRAMFPLTVALLAATILPSIKDARARNRLYVPLAERAMTDVRGANPGSTVVAAAVCGAQNVAPNSGQQTKSDCEKAGGPNFPYGQCIDCGMQKQLGPGAGNNVNDPKGGANCNVNLLLKGDCNSVGPPVNSYQCQNAVADANLTACAGNVPGTTVQPVPTTNPPG